jgi:hypothetical protein
VGHRIGDGASAQAVGGGDAGGCVRLFSVGIWLILAGRQGWEGLAGRNISGAAPAPQILLAAG